jgi:hypothetical protein
MWRGLDAYVIQARVVPAAAVVLPPVVLFGTGVLSGARSGALLGFIGFVVAALAAQVGRDRGRGLQPGLWAEWKGAPTIRRLRYAGHKSPDRVRRLHERIEEVLGERMPSQADEEQDPQSADDRYDEVAGRIRARTQDHKRFRLLFSENVSYGLRRNLLGLKPVGIGVAVATCAICGVLFWLTSGSAAHRAVRFAPAAGVSLAMLAFWLIVVRRAWVKLPAEAYADQFVAAVEQLHAEVASPPSAA